MSIQFSEKSDSVLVTGGTGFVGQHVVNQLLADGKRVTVLTRDLRKAQRLFDGRVTCIHQLSELSADEVIDVVINLAGARILGWRWTDARKFALYKSRVDLTNSLVEWMSSAKQKPQLFLTASAIGYYGIQALGDDTPLTEKSPAQSLFMSRLCADWENAARQAVDLGVRVVAMRFGLILGHGGALPMMLQPIKWCMGGPLGSGRQWLSWIHIDDVLSAMAHVWRVQSAALSTENKATFTAFNFTAPKAVSQRKFTRVAAKLLHRPSAFPTPAWLMRLLLGEQADLLVEGQQVVPARLQSTGFRFQFSDIESALQQLLKPR